jgi:hypothetical protein
MARFTLFFDAQISRCRMISQVQNAHGEERDKKRQLPGYKRREQKGAAKDMDFWILAII